MDNLMKCILDKIPAGVLVFDNRLQVIFSNKWAALFLKRYALPDEIKVLSKRIFDAIKASKMEELFPGEVYFYKKMESSSSKWTFKLDVCDDTGPYVSVFITEESISQKIDLLKVRRHFKLTRRETDVIRRVLNGFKNTESTFMKESGGVNRGFELAEGGWGWIDVTSIKTPGGENLTGLIEFIHPDDDNSKDKTVIRVPLSKPVLPGQTIQLDLTFTASCRGFLREPAIITTSSWWVSGFRRSAFMKPPARDMPPGDNGIAINSMPTRNSLLTTASTMLA